MAASRPIFPVFATAARNARLRRLLLAFAAFRGAEVGVWLALIVYAYGVGGAWAASVIMIVSLIPGALLAPWLGTWADRRRPGRVLMSAYLVFAFGLAAIAALIAAGAPAWIIFVLAPWTDLPVSAAGSAQAALLPAIVESPEELSAAVAAQGWLDSTSTVAAPTLAAILLATGGASLAIAGMACLAVSATLAVARVPGPAPFERDGAAGSAGSRGLVRANLRLIIGNPAARTMVGLLGGQYLMIGALDLIYVILAVSVLEMGESGAGYLTAAYGVGGMLAIVVTARLIGSRHLGRAMILGALAAVAALLALAATPTVVSALALLAVVGVARGVFDVSGRTLLQRTVSPNVLASAFGLLGSLLNVGLIAGALLVPLLVLAGGATLAIAGTAGVLLLLLLLGLPSLRRADRAAHVPVVEINLLRSGEIFASLPAPALETLARELHRVSAPAGSVIIRQGEDGDRYYGIMRGELDVICDGVVIDHRSPGEGVGEIALIRGTPRTASVVAETDVDLYALEREPFVLALTGHATARQRADAVADLRMNNVLQTRSRQREAQ